MSDLRLSLEIGIASSQDDGEVEMPHFDGDLAGISFMQIVISELFILNPGDYVAHFVGKDGYHLQLDQNLTLLEQGVSSGVIIYITLSQVGLQPSHSFTTDNSFDTF